MASWYNSNYKFRVPITLLCQGGGTEDYEIDISPAHEHFWTTIQSTGYDIRVTAFDGITLLTYDRDNFNYANRTLQIEIDNYSCGASSIPQFAWLYYGYDAATDGITAFVPAAAKVGRISLEAPPAAYTVVCGLENPGSTAPRNVITKNSAETIFVYWDITDLLAKGQNASAGSLLYEAVTYLFTSKVLVAGVDQAAMHTAVSAASSNPHRILEHKGRIYLRTDAIGGASGTDYTLEITFYTTMGQATAGDSIRTVVSRALLKVRDVSEV